MFAITSLFPKRRARRRVLHVMVLSLLASCGGDPATTPVVLTAINVTLVSSALQVGQTTTVRAIGVDQTGASLDLSGVTWSSGNSGVATVDTGGHITAVAPGQAQITAISGSKSGQAILTVIPAPVAAVAVTPPRDVVGVGFTLQMTAVALDSSGAPLTGRAVSWSTSDATRATVSPSGLVTGVSYGDVTITATSESKSGSAEILSFHIEVVTVEVKAQTATMTPDSTQQLTARTLSRTGLPIPDRVVSWSSSDASKATVNESGLVTAVAVGSAIITATSEGKSGSAQITVVLAPATSPSAARR
ncbi:MAG TPA: Ig-like domain-containing protein [Gemmatimonadaceae bacterium]|nr:Ig-like domain-containing protein [Gemmatimonadaceae bacterium]